jgi:hypothetical protein
VLGGATVFLTLPLTGIAIRRDAFVAFVAAFIVVTVAQVALRYAIYRVLDPTGSAWSVHPLRLLLGSALLIAGFVTGATGTFPAHPDSFGWWCAIGFALAAVGIGIVTRKDADDLDVALSIP